MKWNLEGMYVEGVYCGDIPVGGVVTHSRVALAGRVKHHVELAHGINWENRIVRPKGDVVIIEHSTITCVKDIE
jgi:hypothetical protein